MKKILFLYCFLGIGALLHAKPVQFLVGPEDTVYSIAYNYGIPTRTLIAANNLLSPYTLMTGQTLFIPGPGEHIVGKGETLASIAEEYGIKVDVFAQENQLGSPYFVKTGDVLVIPSRDTESVITALTPESPAIVTSSLPPLPSVKTTPLKETEERGAAPLPSLPKDVAAELAHEKEESPAKKQNLKGNLSLRSQEETVEENLKTEQPLVKEKPKKLVKEETKKEREEAPLPSKDEDVEIVFGWPLEGKVIRKFNAGKNDGINIEVAEGTSVKASREGEVVYAGNELKDFGNLLLINHPDGWTTVYAYLSELLVKKGDKVKKGKIIAKSGQTGDAKIPQLHFEMRKMKKAVDPLTQLKS